MLTRKEEKIAFSFWANGSELQCSPIYTGEEIKSQYARMCEYWENGNTIASWFEGTICEAEKEFASYPEIIQELYL